MQALELLRHIGRAPEVLVARKSTPAVAGLVGRYLQVGGGEYPFRVPLTGGGSLTLASPAEVRVFWQIFVHGSYALPDPCRTILDCGANVGIFSVWAARRRPHARIVALEPFPATFEALEANIRDNGLADRVECLQVGLAAEASHRLIRVAGDSPNRQLVLGGTADPSEQTITVQCVDLTECLRRHELDDLDLLKMDIEGSEWEVLLSTPPDVLARIRHIQLEYHEVNARFGYTPDMLFAHLARAGHRLTSRHEDTYRTGLARFERA
jgi:FkbM family methyltransferase